MTFNIVFVIAILAVMMLFGHNHAYTKLAREIMEEKTLTSMLNSIIDQKANDIANHWSNRSWIRALPGFRWIFADGPDYQQVGHTCPVPDGKSYGILDFVTLGRLRMERNRLRCENEALFGSVQDYVKKINLWNCSIFAKLRGKCLSENILIENLRSELRGTTGQDLPSLLAKILAGIVVITSVWYLRRFVSSFISRFTSRLRRTENSTAGVLEIRTEDQMENAGKETSTENQMENAGKEMSTENQMENTEKFDDCNEEGLKVEVIDSTHLDISNESQMVNTENCDELNGVNVEVNCHNEEERREEEKQEEQVGEKDKTGGGGNTYWDYLLALSLTWEEWNHPPKNESNSVGLTDPMETSNEIQRCNKTKEIDCGVRPFGLCNMGNTCYMNSALQVLMKALEKHADHLSENFNGSSLTGGLVANEMQRLIGLRGKEKVVRPVEFRNLMANVKAAYGTKEQQDASEFFFDVLERLNDDLNRVQDHKGNKVVSMENIKDDKPDDILAQIFTEKNNELGHSMITDLFQGLNRFTKLCGSCGKRSVDFSMSMDVGLPFPTANQRYSLQELLENRFQEELLDGYKCDFCHERGQVVRKEDLYVLPDYLVLRLNRFAFSMETFTMQKIDSAVEFPEEMRLGDFSGVNGKPNEKCYDLLGVVNHYGNLNFGHYTSVVKGDDGKWNECNDDIVRSMSTLNCKFDNSAYMLVYKLKKE
ncbi:uncharacterized protein [Palaemon carinicauda]|uniref:uncharacterized protein n=1 Tax=Palaemon carinicauda TaxID=392227 RepID=UPI0035B62A3F